jgi:hypothetical protein
MRIFKLFGDFLQTKRASGSQPTADNSRQQKSYKKAPLAYGIQPSLREKGSTLAASGFPCLTFLPHFVVPPPSERMEVAEEFQTLRFGLIKAACVFINKEPPFNAAALCLFFPGRILGLLVLFTIIHQE